MEEEEAEEAGAGEAAAEADLMTQTQEERRNEKRKRKKRKKHFSKLYLISIIGKHIVAANFEDGIGPEGIHSSGRHTLSLLVLSEQYNNNCRLKLFVDQQSGHILTYFPRGLL
mgnify:CR=1 FL=1